jgi:hypothetical protein
MAWTLGSTTLPEPKSFQRKFVDKSVFHEMVNGSSKRDLTSSKEQFMLTFTKLTQAIVASVLAAKSAHQSLLFEVTDGDLSIASRSVHVDIPDRNYNTKGSEFREDIQLILTDVESQY